MRRIIILPVAALALGLGGCAGGDQMTAGGRDVLLGGAGGALAGAAIGSFTASAGMGALIGAGVGVVGGYLWNQHEIAERQAAERRQAQLNAAYQRGVQQGERQHRSTTSQ
ncbi:glycine zipper domain-containing protein [Roseomonas fluvialis]|uniref:Glycine zipper domain-containing protein n=1 Tax=Roseomonas fluvialis TaxID=1750527 RepID=A0ABM7Y3L6_9PROT|nr:glycine zipper domain-containing protein [Roseomonas fluvialis]BDG72439.1 hypothetical protein Rmf_23680 [Roseomonas fluvialis]